MKMPIHPDGRFAEPILKPAPLILEGRLHEFDQIYRESKMHTTRKPKKSRLSETAGKFGNIKNSSDRLLSLNSDKLALTANIVYKHKFQKEQAYASINTDWNLLNTDSRNTQQSALTELELINQQTNVKHPEVGIVIVHRAFVETNAGEKFRIETNKPNNPCLFHSIGRKYDQL